MFFRFKYKLRVVFADFPDRLGSSEDFAGKWFKYKLRVAFADFPVLFSSRARFSASLADVVQIKALCGIVGPFFRRAPDPCTGGSPGAFVQALCGISGPSDGPRAGVS